MEVIYRVITTHSEYNGALQTKGNLQPVWTAETRVETTNIWNPNTSIQERSTSAYHLTLSFTYNHQYSI